MASLVSAVPPRARTSLLWRVAELMGLSAASFLVVFALARFLTRSLSHDSMRFLLPRSHIVNTSGSFKLSRHWAGSLPPQAQEMLDMFNYPDVYAHFGSQLPRGVLLYGLPGTGKTYLARVLAEMTDAAFLYASASQFDEIFVGKGAQRVRHLFETAQSMTEYTTTERLLARLERRDLPPKKVIVFIDELDSIGTRNNLHGLNSTNHATVSQLLTCLDGLADRGNVFVIGATNSLETIDPALRRSGRFDRVIHMPLPDEASRADLLAFYLKERPGYQALANGGVVRRYAALTHGFSAADVKNFASEVQMKAVQSTIAARKATHAQRIVTLDAEGLASSICEEITEEHFQHAFALLVTKIQKERPQFRTKEKQAVSLDDSID